MNWGDLGALIVVVIGFFGIYKNARLNKEVGPSLRESAMMGLAVLLIYGSIVLARMLLS